MKLAKRCEKVLIMSMVAAMIAPSTFAATKNEMVFVTANSQGETQKIIVSNHLEVNNETEVKDISELENIINLKGDEVPTKDGNNLTWRTNGKDIYYQGETTKALPVETEVTYVLDGKEMAPEELSGKSGHLKITVKQTNTVKAKKIIEGKERELYAPFYSLGMIMLDADVMQNIEITNGKLLSDGSRKAVVGVILPGMSENLGNKGIDLVSDTIEIEGDVEEFYLAPIYISTSANLPELSDIKGLEEFDNMTENLNKLVSSGNQLVKGSTTLFSSMSLFNTKIKEFQSGMNNFINGAGQLTSGISSLQGGAIKLNTGANSLYENSVAYANKGKELVAGVDKQTAAINSLNDALAQVLSTLSDDLPQKAALTQISGGMSQLKESSMTLGTSLSSYVNKANDLAAGAKALDDGSESLVEGLNSAVEGTKTLEQGSGKLTSGMNSLVDATSQLEEGAKTLATGMNEFNKEGILKLKEGVSDKLNSLSEFLEIKDALVEIAKDYTTFTGNNEANDSKVEFVVKIEGVDRMVVEDKTTNIAANETKISVEKKGFLESIKEWVKESLA